MPLDLADDDDWAERFRLAVQSALATPASVPGYHGPMDFSPDLSQPAVAKSEGDNYGAPWLALVRLTHGALAFVRGQCDCTTTNGSCEWDPWEGASAVTVEIGGTVEDLVCWSMTNEDRWRLGFSLGGRTA